MQYRENKKLWARGAAFAGGTLEVSGATMFHVLTRSLGRVMTGFTFLTWFNPCITSYALLLLQELADEIGVWRRSTGEETTLIPLGGNNFMIISREGMEARRKVGAILPRPPCVVMS
jgi:hypothetical protein